MLGILTLLVLVHSFIWGRRDVVTSPTLRPQAQGERRGPLIVELKGPDCSVTSMTRPSGGNKVLFKGASASNKVLFAAGMF